MSQTGKSDIIRAIFAAYLANDRTRVDNALADDFHFTSPYDDNIDKPTYFERCWNNTDWIARHELERILVEGDEAFVIYLCIARDGKRFRNTEFFSFAGDKVKRIDVYFGASYQNGKFVPQSR
jgi:ketosteroid isomerase-like protein